ncbi:MAG: hypothetical protein ACKO2P_04420 [Planctomycetota bacterium]
MGRRFSGRRDDSGSWLASLLILAVGLGFCAFLALASDPRSALTACSVLAGILGVFLLLNRLNRAGRLTSLNLSFLSISSRSRRDDGIHDYQPRKAAAASAKATPNQPITAGEARELRMTSSSTWIPAQGRKKKSRDT